MRLVWLVLQLLCLLLRTGFSLVCYDASVILRDETAEISVPLSTSSVQNSCKACLTLVVTQKLTEELDPNVFPINMTRRLCGKTEGMSCAAGNFKCPLDDSTFQRPPYILRNKPVHAQIVAGADKRCSCCDSDFCNGPSLLNLGLSDLFRSICALCRTEPTEAIPCNVTEPISQVEMMKCIGCIVDQRKTWDGQIKQATRCLSTGCEDYQNDCLPCDATDFEQCKCSCSINFPKIGKFSQSFVTPNKRPPQVSVRSPGMQYEMHYKRQASRASCAVYGLFHVFLSVVIAAAVHKI